MNQTHERGRVFSSTLSLLPHLALPLLVPSKELPDLIQEAGVLLPPAQPEGGLCGAACGCHACSDGWQYLYCACRRWGSCRSLK